VVSPKSDLRKNSAPRAKKRKAGGALFRDGRYLGTPEFFGFQIISDTDCSGNTNGYPIRSRCLHAGFQAIGVELGSNDKH